MVGNFILVSQWSLWWWGILSLLGVCCVGWYALRVHRVLGLLAAAPYRAHMVRGFSPLWFTIRLCAAAGAFVLLWLALLRPQYPTGSPIEQFEFARDMVIAVDISRSMLVEDEVENGDASHQKISRMERAHQLITHLVQQVQLERIALVAFSGSALTLCPLTKDVGALTMFIDLLSPDMMSGGGTTSLEAAINEAISLFSGHTSNRHKLLVVITDGEDFSPQLAQAQKKAAEAGLHISMIGLGTEQGGPVPCYNEKHEKVGYQKDKAGAIVISRLNEHLLKSIAQQYHGLYLPRSLSHDAAVDKLMSWIRLREADQIAHRTEEGRGDLFMGCIAAALILLVIAWI